MIVALQSILILILLGNENDTMQSHLHLAHSILILVDSTRRPGNAELTSYSKLQKHTLQYEQINLKCTRYGQQVDGGDI